MKNPSISIRFKPLTALFFGTRQSISPQEYVKSLIIPTAYTVGGAALRLISEVCDVSFDDIEEYVEGELIEFRGPYITADFNGKFRYFIPAPPVDRIEEPEILKEINAGYIRLDGLKVAKPVIKPHLERVTLKWLKLIELTFENGVWSPNRKSIAWLKTDIRDTTSFSMNRITRTVEIGTLYSRTLISNYILESELYGLTNNVAISCDVGLSEDAYNKLVKFKQTIMRFGGEGGMVKAEVTLGETPLINACRLAEKRDGIKLAVSHIPLEKRGSNFYTHKLGLIEWLLGRIELIGGWLLNKHEMKEHTLAITPGSIFKVARETPMKTRYWYFNLLSSIVNWS